jgi:hypothetical protein
MRLKEMIFAKVLTSSCRVGRKRGREAHRCADGGGVVPSVMPDLAVHLVNYFLWKAWTLRKKATAPDVELDHSQRITVISNRLI